MIYKCRRSDTVLFVVVVVVNLLLLLFILLLFRFRSFILFNYVCELDFIYDMTYSSLNHISFEKQYNSEKC